MFQLFALYPHMNVRKNIGFSAASARACRRRRSTAGSRRPRASCASSIILDKSVSGLSGGDRQRVALGRAIVREPMCFLMDEPLGALDSEFRAPDVRRAARAAQPLKATTVYVTHDQLEAMSMADKIAVMNRGVIEQFGPPQEIYDRPASMFVADFIGSPPMNFLHFHAGSRAAPSEARLGDAVIAMPALHEDVAAARPGAGRPAGAHRVRRQLGAARRGLRQPSISGRPRSSPSTPRSAR